MSKYLDLDDAVANVTGDVAKRELDELRTERDQLAAQVERLRGLLSRVLDTFTQMKGCSRMTQIRGAIEVMEREIYDALHDPAPQPQPDWIACSERLPTEEDADYEGKVWRKDHDRTEASLVPWGWVYPISGDYWKPTGLKLPEPPEDV